MKAGRKENEIINGVEITMFLLIDGFSISFIFYWNIFSRISFAIIERFWPPTTNWGCWMVDIDMISEGNLQ